jgi:transcriptional regulator with XRE-family HTH domain
VLGLAIRGDRERQGLTREQLAERVRAGGGQVSARSIGNLEAGKVPKRGTKPPSVEPVVAALKWRPGWADRILAGEDVSAVLRSDTDTSPNATARSWLIEMVPKVFQFSREAVRLGADPELRDQFDQLAQRLAESAPADRPVRVKYDLAASRPHALGEGVPADDAARIDDAIRRNG